MGELVEKVLKMLKKNSVGFVIEGSRMAVYSPFSELKGPVVVGT